MRFRRAKYSASLEYNFLEGAMGRWGLICICWPCDVSGRRERWWARKRHSRECVFVGRPSRLKLGRYIARAAYRLRVCNLSFSLSIQRSILSRLFHLYSSAKSYRTLGQEEFSCKKGQLIFLPSTCYPPKASVVFHIFLSLTKSLYNFGIILKRGHVPSLWIIIIQSDQSSRQFRSKILGRAQLVCGFAGLEYKPHSEECILWKGIKLAGSAHRASKLTTSTCDECALLSINYYLPLIYHPLD